MPVAEWGPAMRVDRAEHPHGQYSTVPTNDNDSAQIQWNPNYNPGYIKSIASGLGLSSMGSRTTMSECSATESNMALTKPDISKASTDLSAESKS